MTLTETGRPQAPAADMTRASTRFGIAFTVCQLLVMVAMTVFVLPHAGSPTDPALERGQNVFDAAQLYRIGNFAFMAAGTLLLGFLGAVHVRLRRADGSGALATVAVAAGALLALIWPLGGMLHDVALETASAGADLRILAGWDSVAPFGLAFSVFARVFFVGPSRSRCGPGAGTRGWSARASSSSCSASPAARPWCQVRCSRCSR
ncbi:hypothetical protein [Dactylosporangium sp. NPDC006015]|uniref:hypothetical protein n=1 Tax=Dactylosporangium sp. NPDC006015 TaxID=3154576 RepID=UPI0033B56F89